MEFDPDCVYEMNADFNFMDDYDPKKHWFITIEEVGSKSKNHDDGKGLANILKVTGDAPFVVPVADLNKIGLHYLTQYSTVLTSNADDLGMEGVLTNPGAVTRRLFKVVFAAHPSAKMPGETSCIDWRKIACPGMDDILWNGSVKMGDSRDASTMRWKEVAKFNTIREYLAIMVPLIQSKQEAAATFN